MKVVKKKKDFTGILTVGVWIVIGIAFAVIILLYKNAEKNAQAKIDALLLTDDPVSNLILALSDKKSSIRDAAANALDEIGDPLLVTLAPVCWGNPVPASSYEPDSPGPHPLVLLDTAGKRYDWTYEFLNEWGPSSREAGDVQLVACISEIEKKLETCYYPGQKIIRIQHGLTIYVREASTGNEVAKKTFMASKPGGCPMSLSGANNDDIIYKSGGWVSSKTVKNWLAEFYQ